MNIEDIKKARKNYKRIIKEKEELIELKGQIKEIETLNKEEIIIKSFEGLNSKSTSKYNLYVYIGAYVVDEYGLKFDYLLTDENKADYYLYRNLDNSLNDVIVFPENKKNFKENNIILYFKNSSEVEKKYSQLQTYYYQLLLTENLKNKSKILIKLKEKTK
ncbi:MAG TPA: hypothetical protein PLV83_04525 [Bacilli bacterium]|nr:hypothetical protein [Bacilli bacterium]